ncbi:Pseudouridine synthase I, TruA [Syntrophomonas zehnderi OL-4]|uniref:tRNA pseudouridine synthase A n=1 Tax=Syntrophomonas zehnderi OL-4 TaxID=690567 RepID=A0A0E3W2K3_9FIRM|nr:tRNA pseudouridine(38-40) synthase TruA [Syntrophomonas zehnderi]CFX05474.1 Pseudouridine synthase I, TruA [Syntrophomonas zehnderi OL-4]CFX34670.1 Pseudouridine synthase I, TruA [Syntrophomonas zehnderi OL-4]
MKRIKMVLEYDGSNYHGFQRQINAHTIQAQLESSINHLTGETVTVNAAGRTDAGVHALGQVIAFNTSARIPADKWTPALNSKLPDDIRILNSLEAAPDFHPQFDALKKSYVYLIYRQKSGASFYRKHALLNSENLDVAGMQRAARLLEGNHNFKAFCASGSSVKSFKRNVSLCRIINQEAWLKLEIEANGFLYNMIRIIMGTLLEVGRQRLTPEHILEILDSQDRNLAGSTVSPHGLYLKAVEYPEG